MSNENRTVRVLFGRCPNEPPQDDPHWVLMDWRSGDTSAVCRFHGGGIRVRFREPLQRGLVTLEEAGRGWATVIPDVCDGK